jgi:hypothetical protein
MTAVAMIFVVGWLVVLSFAIAAVTVAMKTVRPSSSPEHEQLVRSLRRPITTSFQPSPTALSTPTRLTSNPTYYWCSVTSVGVTDRLIGAILPGMTWWPDGRLDAMPSDPR